MSDKIKSVQGYIVLDDYGAAINGEYRIYDDAGDAMDASVERLQEILESEGMLDCFKICKEHLQDFHEVIIHTVGSRHHSGIVQLKIATIFK